MAIRKGLGRGRGKGYRNIIGKDPRVHSDSSRGRKQPQKIPNNLILKYRLRQKQDQMKLSNEFEEGILSSIDLTKKQLEKKGYGLFTLSNLEGTSLYFEGIGYGIVSEKWDKLSTENKEKIILKEKAMLNELANSTNGNFEIVKSNAESYADTGLVFSKQFSKEEPKKLEKIRKRLKKEGLFDKLGFGL